MPRRFSENELIVADDREKNNLCPFCGGRPTIFENRPNECCSCYLPVIFWKIFRESKISNNEL